MTKPEVLAPVQDFTTLTAAIDAGADAVFFGVRGYNMRVSAKNFTVDDLPKIAEQTHRADVKAYIALNTILFDEELPGMVEVLEKSHAAGIDAVICWDHAVIRAAQKIGIEVHLSTQASVANTEAARFYQDLGITRVVLARECSLEQIATIRENTGLEIETFVHGAMCISVSGRCFMSQFTTGCSANRGACRQPCRRSYHISDTEGEFQFEVGPDYVMSPKDLCTLPFIEELIYAGIDSLKIEGRNKGPEYVSDVTSVYRQVVDFVCGNFERKGTEDFRQELDALKDSLLPKLQRVFNRGFSGGFYMGRPLNEWSGRSGSAATERKVYIGKVEKFYPKISVAEIRVHAGETLSVGDSILIQGDRTGNYRATIDSMEIEHEKVTKVKQGQIVAIKLNSEVRANDTVSKLVSMHENS